MGAPMHYGNTYTYLNTAALGEINQHGHGCFMLQEQLWETPHGVYRSVNSQQEAGKPTRDCSKNPWGITGWQSCVQGVTRWEITFPISTLSELVVTPTGKGTGKADASSPVFEALVQGQTAHRDGSVLEGKMQQSFLHTPACSWPVQQCCTVVAGVTAKEGWNGRGCASHATRQQTLTPEDSPHLPRRVKTAPDSTLGRAEVNSLGFLIIQPYTAASAGFQPRTGLMSRQTHHLQTHCRYCCCWRESSTLLQLSAA